MEFTSCAEYMSRVSIRRDIFQGNSLSSLLFVDFMVPLTQILRKVDSRYSLKNAGTLYHLLLMDDFMIFTKSQR